MSAALPCTLYFVVLPDGTYLRLLRHDTTPSQHQHHHLPPAALPSRQLLPIADDAVRRSTAHSTGKSNLHTLHRHPSCRLLQRGLPPAAVHLLCLISALPDRSPVRHSEAECPPYKDCELSATLDTRPPAIAVFACHRRDILATSHT